MKKVDYAIQTNNLSKIYGDKEAVSHLNMEVKRGDIYGFIGPNGSGKSTTLKMCCGLVHPNEGEVSLFGATVKDPIVRRRVGILIEEAGLYPHLTARENMILQAHCLGLTDNHSIDELLKLIQLEQTGKKKVKYFSMGMKQRLGIAMALLGNPDLLILDEPTNGLDPEGTREIRKFLQDLNQKSGKTIIISSHNLGELSKMATRYGIIKDGKLIQEITKEELVDKCRDYLLVETDQTDRATALLAETFPQSPLAIHEQQQIRIFDNIDSGAVTTMLVQHNIAVKTCTYHHQDLEQYFLNVMEGGNAHV